MSRSTRKRVSTSKTNVPKKTVEKKVEPLSENIFASPWKNSDVVLVCDKTEFHVHRTILTMHSPVFEVMFGGNFKEANQEKIVLPGKDSDVMLQFLKLLYPESMIRTPTIDFSEAGDKVIYDVLRIADEYQTEELIRKCLAKVFIFSANVFEILPYASKYNFNIREKCVSHVAKYVKMDMLEKQLNQLEAPLMQELLVEKCRHLETCLQKYEKKSTAVVIKGTTEDSSSEASSESSSDGSA